MAATLLIKYGNAVQIVREYEDWTLAVCNETLLRSFLKRPTRCEEILISRKDGVEAVPSKGLTGVELCWLPHSNYKRRLQCL
jgi:hypothetical protein